MAYRLPAVRVPTKSVPLGLSAIDLALGTSSAKTLMLKPGGSSISPGNGIVSGDVSCSGELSGKDSGEASSAADFDQYRCATSKEQQCDRYQYKKREIA